MPAFPKSLFSFKNIHGMSRVIVDLLFSSSPLHIVESSQVFKNYWKCILCTLHVSGKGCKGEWVVYLHMLLHPGRRPLSVSECKEVTRLAPTL